MNTLAVSCCMATELLVGALGRVVGKQLYWHPDCVWVNMRTGYFFGDHRG